MRYIKCGMLAGLIAFGLHVSWMLGAGLHDEIDLADIAVVLGNKVEKDGTPSPRLQIRLDRAVMLYQQKQVKKIVVSGGKVADRPFEVEVMRDYLVKHQVPSEAIILDKEGHNTRATARNTFRIMQEHHYRSVIIVSHYYHILRTRLAFEQAGIKNPYHAHAILRLDLHDLYSICREFVAYYWYAIRGIIVKEA